MLAFFMGGHSSQGRQADPPHLFDLKRYAFVKKNGISVNINHLFNSKPCDDSGSGELLL
jgi:hypothetical protein